MEPWSHRNFERFQPILELACLQQLRPDLNEGGERANPGDAVVQTECVGRRNHEQAPEIRDTRQALDLEGAAERGFPFPSCPAESPRLRRCCFILRLVPEAVAAVT